MPFPLELRTKLLLWCDRHCCLCKKAAGINIEVHHLVPERAGGPDDIDNAIPLCFDCHGHVEHYNSEHPVGTKYRVEELRQRREQVYEEFTRHLVPPIHYQLTQDLGNSRARTFPDVGFILTHPGDSLPVKVRVQVAPERPDKPLQIEDPIGYYNGRTPWHLNPRFAVSGHFRVPEAYSAGESRITLSLNISIIDQYEREHSHLPVGYTYDMERKIWYLEPWSRGV
jgi:hypothetical protein